MSTCTLTINGKPILAGLGETLVDAALSGRTLIPHDCCSGQCETCRVTVLDGTLDADGTAERDTVLACKAKLSGDVSIHYDEVPEAVRVQATVTAMRPLSPDILEVVLQLKGPLVWWPGQYVGVAFAGFPSRDYSPAPRIEGGREDELVLHIRVLSDGVVSSQLGQRINIGHKAQVRGPHGRAFYRLGSGRLVLVAGGTGWAPIWAVAREAKLRQPGRPLTVIVGAHEVENLYMSEEAEWLRASGADIIMTSSLAQPGDKVAKGRPTDHLPQLDVSDVVYVAGALGLVNAVKQRALAADAVCYADPFLPGTQKIGLMDRLTGFLRSPGKAAPAASVLAPRPAKVPQVAASSLAGAPGPESEPAPQRRPNPEAVQAARRSVGSA
jgi:3-phenylpropionate/trans-cinnamate dioxygenase ferredoxin reductase subunit